MAKLYFLGGEDTGKRDSREINRKAFVDAGGEPSVLVFPWARESFDRLYASRKSLVEYFRVLGARNVVFAEYSDSPLEIAEKAWSSELIYLTGGRVSVLLERLETKGVDNLLRLYDGVIVGRSAGALALCKTCVLSKKRNKRANVRLSGIGLVPIGVKVHYRFSKDDQLRELSMGEEIYAIPEGSAIVFDHGILSFVGDVYRFQNGVKTRVG